MPHRLGHCRHWYQNLGITSNLPYRMARRKMAWGTIQKLEPKLLEPKWLEPK
jgi:hypothetical protein